MGSPITETELVNGVDRGDDEVQHDVTVSSFYMAEYEVTQSQYESVIGSNPSAFPLDGSDAPNRPVEKVSWFDALVFCNALSEAGGPAGGIYHILGFLLAKIISSERPWTGQRNGYPLPTEAEWEYAARGGNKSKGYLYSGSNTADEVASWPLSDGSVPNGTYDVGTKVPNELGLHDMSGNVSEFCWDWYGDYDLGTGAKTDPMGAVKQAPSGLHGAVTGPQNYTVYHSGLPGAAKPVLMTVFNSNGFRLVLSCFLTFHRRQRQGAG